MDLTDIAMYCKIKQSEREADKYKQQSDLYESVLTGEVTEFVYLIGGLKLDEVHLMLVLS